MGVLIELLNKDSPFDLCQPFPCENDFFDDAVGKLVPLLEFFDQFPVNVQYLLVSGGCNQCRLFAVIHGEQIDIIGVILVFFAVEIVVDRLVISAEVTGDALTLRFRLLCFI